MTKDKLEMRKWEGIETGNTVFPKMKTGNAALDKSYQFALDSLKLYEILKREKEYTVGRQILRCGTSIGANVEEALGGHSRKDFAFRISVAYKEAREAHYWLRLLRDGNYLCPEKADLLIKKADELIRILGSIQKTMLNRSFPKK